MRSLLSHWAAKGQLLPRYLLLLDWAVMEHHQEDQLDSFEVAVAAKVGFVVANWTGSSSARWQPWGFGEVFDY